MTCPLCSSTDTEDLDDGRSYCPACRIVFHPEPRTRKDTDA